MRSILAAACAVLLIITSCHAQEKQPLQIHIDSVRLEHIDREQVQAKVLMSTTGPKELHVERIALNDLRVNGTPVFADPVDMDVKTTGGTVALPPIHLHIYLADIENAAWLESLLREQRASMTAVAFVNVHANLLQRIVLGEVHTVAVWAIQKEVPLHVSDGLSSPGVGPADVGAQHGSTAGTRNLRIILQRHRRGRRHGTRANLLDPIGGGASLYRASSVYGGLALCYGSTGRRTLALRPDARPAAAARFDLC